jgi:hypothetical protein
MEQEKRCKRMREKEEKKKMWEQEGKGERWRKRTIETRHNRLKEDKRIKGENKRKKKISRE